jgi:peptidoglycan-N-acetylglucosamine deacetylase
VIAALEKDKTKATFFVGGRWAEQDPGRVKQLLADPHFEVESHAFNHPHLTNLGNIALHSEISKANDVLTPLLGHSPRYLRAPYGESDARVVRAAQSLGLVMIKFDLASGDPDPTFTRKRLTRWVLREVKPGSIVVFHVNGRGWHTAEALPEILAGLEKKGLEPVTLAELLSP